MLGRKDSGSKKPWSDIPSGLSREEERADPDLAEAIRESLWASQVGRMELDDDGEVIPSPPPSRPGGSRTVSNSSSASASSSRSVRAESKPITAVTLPTDQSEAFSLTPKYQPPITSYVRDETTLGLDEIMSCISADELRRIAKQRKVPNNLLSKREDVCAALRGVATKQTVLGFAPVRTARRANGASDEGAGGTGNGNGKGKAKSRPLSITSESLLIAQLLPLIGNHALVLTPEIHKLISRVNLIFSRTPPLTSAASSLMLPSILVTSHRRRYPDYGPPTRSVIWTDRDELLSWERAVQWEAVVGDALGDSWAEQRTMRPNVPMLSRIEGAKVVKRVWEGVWPVWCALVQGEMGQMVDPRKQQGGLVGDRFKAGELRMRE